MLVIKCPQCFREFSIQVTQCPECGFPVENLKDYILEAQEADRKAPAPRPAKPAKPEPARPPVGAEPKRYCEECGAVLSAESSFCAVCGKKVKAESKKKPKKPSLVIRLISKKHLSFFLVNAALFGAFLAFHISMEAREKPSASVKIKHSIAEKAVSTKDPLMGRHLNSVAWNNLPLPPSLVRRGNNSLKKRNDIH